MDITGSLVEYLYGTRSIMRNKDVGGEELPETKDAMRNLARITWPSVLESVLMALIGLVDTAMVSPLGKEAIAAVGLSSQPRFLFLAIFMSLNTGIIAVVSRRKGQDDRESANKTLRQVLLFSSLLAIVLSFIGVFFSRDMVVFIGAKADTVDMAASYTSIVIGGMFFNALALNINAAQRGCGNTRITLKTNLTANIIKLCLNYLLIYGNLGFPKLGVAGAALATVLGYSVAFFIAFASIRKPEGFLYLDFKKSFLPDKQTLAPLINVSSSAAVEQIFMRAGMLVFSMIIANLGTTAYAAHMISSNFMMIAFGFGDGLAISTASLVGQSLGSDKPGSALLYGNLSQRVGLTIGMFLALVFLVFGRVLATPFTNDAELLALCAILLAMLSILVPAQISQVIYSTNLRVSGDTKYVALVSLVGITFVRTISAYVLCYPLGLGMVGAWLGLLIDQYLRLVLNGVRFKRGKWAQIKI